MQVFCNVHNRWMSIPEFYQQEKKAHRYGPFWTGEPLDSVHAAIHGTRQAIYYAKRYYSLKKLQDN